MFQETLPIRPYCADTLEALVIRPRLQALKKRYIQQNSPWDLRWLVYDVDRPLAAVEWQGLNAPAPNFTVTNLENGHAHLFYGLKVPVYKQPEAHIKPLRFAASIDVALTQKLEADPGYSGLICKNPYNDFWRTDEFYPWPYDLNQLTTYLDLSEYRDARKHLPEIGLGRNCTLFDVTRRWAYRQIRVGGFFGEEFFIYEVIRYAAERNGDFSVPLPYAEVKATGKSIGRWTWRNMSPGGFRAWGDNRRERSIAVRKAKSRDRAEEIRAYKRDHPELSIRAISGKLGYSLGRINRALRGGNG